MHLIRHFRLPFSLLLLPVFLLALATVETIRIVPTVLAFLILHVLVYPSSNAYNSLQDRDTGPIGGIEHPEAVPPIMGPLTILIDLLAIGLSALVSPVFMACVVLYVLFSRLYSFRGIRFKKHPVMGYLTVVLSQGALIYFAVYRAISGSAEVPVSGLIISTLLLGAFYPVTQIYQHEQDRQDQVRTISAALGIRGTFIYCALLYGIAFLILGNWLYASGKLLHFGILLLALSPVLVWFLRWAIQCFRNPALADYRHTMQMSWRAAGCTNIAFFLLAILPHRFG